MGNIVLGQTTQNFCNFIARAQTKPRTGVSGGNQATQAGKSGGACEDVKDKNSWVEMLVCGVQRQCRQNWVTETVGQLSQWAPKEEQPPQA